MKITLNTSSIKPTTMAALIAELSQAHNVTDDDCDTMRILYTALVGNCGAELAVKLLKDADTDMFVLENLQD